MRLIGYLGVALALYGAFVGALFVFQRHLLYYPQTARLEPADFGIPEMRALRLTTSDGVAVTAWYRAPPGAAPVVVYFHGNAGHLGYRAGKLRPYLEAGFGLLAVSYRGYGDSEGRPTESGLFADGHAALAFLEGEGIVAGRIFLYGESLGSAVAVPLAAGRRLGGVVLEAPFTSVGDLAAHHYPFVPARHLVRDRFDSKARIGQLGAPLLVIHGGRDRVVPIHFGRALFEAAPEPKEMIVFESAGHNDLYGFAAAARIVGFIRKRSQLEPLNY